LYAIAGAQCRGLVDVSECGESGAGDQSRLIGPGIILTKSLFEGGLSGLAALERLVCISIDQEQSRQIVI
jgi:hypothetical protein